MVRFLKENLNREFASIDIDRALGRAICAKTKNGKTKTQVVKNQAAC